MAVVEHPFNGDVVNVLVQQAKHLRLLKRAHTAIGAGHEDPHAALTAHGILRRTARVARGGSQNVQRFPTTAQLVLEQVTEQLHGHVFKSQRWAIGQGLNEDALFQLANRHDGIRSKRRFGICLMTQGAEITGGDIVNVERQNFEGEVRVRQRAPRL